MELFFEILILLLYTAVAYLLLSLCIMKKQLTKSQIKKIVFFNGLTVGLVFAIVAINEGGKPTAAVFLYSTIAYVLLKKKCLHEPKPRDKGSHIPKYKAKQIKTAEDEHPTVEENIRVQLSRENEKTYGNYNVSGKDLELKPVTESTKRLEKGKLSETRKQLINLSMNIPEDRVALAIKLLNTINESE